MYQANKQSLSQVCFNKLNNLPALSSRKNMYRIRKAFESLEVGVFFGCHELTFTEDGIASEGKG